MANRGTIADRDAVNTSEAVDHAALERARADLAAARAEVARLRELDDWRHAVLAAVAHDLRSPLAGVRAFAETLIVRAAELPPKKREGLLAGIMTTTDRMTELLEHLLDLDRTTRNAVAARPEVADVGDLVRDVVAEIETVGRPLELDVADGDLRATVDELRLGQAIENLLENAIRHTPPGTAIRIQVTRTADTVRLLVEDDGPGVPAEIANRLFQPFAAQAVQPDEFPGRGLGLSLVQLYVQLHEGWVVHEPTDGGARFVVHLPV